MREKEGGRDSEREGQTERERVSDSESERVSGFKQTSLEGGLVRTRSNSTEAAAGELFYVDRRPGEDASGKDAKFLVDYRYN